jgi:hypothetical protein
MLRDKAEEVALGEFRRKYIPPLLALFRIITVILSHQDAA